jgi:cytochrome c peroxidase
MQEGLGARRGSWGLLAVSALLCAAAAAVADVALPPNVIPPAVPADNPSSKEKIALGRKLFFDKRLSSDGSVACATCHDPLHAFADGRGKATSAGVGGALGARNAPTALNAAFLSAQFWDGRAATLEEQAVQPLINPIEHGFADHAAVVARLREVGDYAEPFRSAFGSDEITIAGVGQAVASFERELVEVSAPIDRFLAGDASAIPEDAKRGWELFNGKARCNTCHGWVESFPLFTDDDFHNIGVGTKAVDFAAASRAAAAAVDAGKSIDQLAVGDAEKSALGRFLVTREQRHLGAFKTPQLRNVARTAPYMHDGSQTTLADVIAFYDKGGEANPYLDGGMRPLALTEQERADLVALLQTFTSDALAGFATLVPKAP